MGNGKQIKTKSDRLKEGVAILKQLRDAGVKEHSLGYLDLKTKISDWVNSEKYSLERINFIDSLANELTTKHYISIEQSKEFILGLMNIYVNLYKSHSLVKYFFKKKFTVKLVNTIISVFKRKPLIVIYGKVRSRVILNRISKDSLLLSDFLDDNLKSIKYFNEVSTLELREMNTSIIHFYSNKSEIDHINTDSI